MGLPGTKRNRTSRDTRRAHDALKKRTAAVCESCKAPILPHRACTSCGVYKGKKMVAVQRRTDRRIRKVKKIS